MKMLSLFLAFTSFVIADVPKIKPLDAAKQVSEGKAVLVDVREPAEWAETGVVASAHLLAKSDFDGAQKEWKSFLVNAKDKQIIVYCKSGRRAEVVATALANQGFSVCNAGGFSAWKEAGLPVRAVTR